MNFLVDLLCERIGPFREHGGVVEDGVDRLGLQVSAEVAETARISFLDSFSPVREQVGLPVVLYHFSPQL